MVVRESSDPAGVASGFDFGDRAVQVRGQAVPGNKGASHEGAHPDATEGPSDGAASGDGDDGSGVTGAVVPFSRRIRRGRQSMPVPEHVSDLAAGVVGIQED